MVAYRWSESYDTLKRSSAKCPSCDVLHNLAPLVTGGRIEDIQDRRSDSHVFRDGAYPIFLPPDIRDPGYAVVLCNNCDDLFVVTIPFHDYEPIEVVWPIPGAEVSVDIPEPVRSAVKDAKLSRAAKSVTGCIMSIRTAVERIQTTEGAGSLGELWTTKGLSPALFDTANEPRLWGNVLTHADFDPAEVTLEHVDDLLDYLDIMLDMVYLTPRRLERSIESRKKLGGEDRTEEKE